MVVTTESLCRIRARHADVANQDSNHHTLTIQVAECTEETTKDTKITKKTKEELLEPVTKPAAPLSGLGRVACSTEFFDSLLEPVTKPAVPLSRLGHVACSLEFCDSLLEETVAVVMSLRHLASDSTSQDLRACNKTRRAAFRPRACCLQHGVLRQPLILRALRGPRGQFLFGLSNHAKERTAP